MATANHTDANAWMESRGTIATPRMSSSSDTPASNSHGTPHTPSASAVLVGATATTGRKPAQIASPPTRGMGTVCKLRALRVASGRRLRQCSRAAVAAAATSAAMAGRIAVATFTSNTRFLRCAVGTKKRATG